jgi:hypothetical protein
MTATAPFRVGGWLPSDQAFLTSGCDLVAKVEAEGDKPLLPVVDEFRRLIEEDLEGVSRNVKRYDRFWIKGQPYSVAHMLAHDPWTGQFTGGTIYQAFLSAQLPPLAQPGGWPDR